ncbi:MAG: hypothetical protein Kow00109_26680 [Acidobacteriota bacterium]
MDFTEDARLGLDEFALFFKALHGHEPFDWQRELARRVLRGLARGEGNHESKQKGGWPRTMELPTAAGKTAVLDIAVFAMAADSSHPRRAPRRCFFVVDRRVVVDSAYERARHIAGKLAAASDGVLRRVADRLRELSGGDIPLATAILRGGMYREDNWALAPTQALLVVSTVDQVGSRLLNRGYGVGDRMKPVHQGLVANDSLIVLDEAHVSAPFAQTLTAVETYQAWAETRVATPFQIVRMSATLTGEAEFSLRQVEEEHGLDERLEPRLRAHKRAKLQLVKMETPPKRKDDRAGWRRFRQGRPARDETFAAAYVETARELLRTGRSRVGVVVSRVGLARRVFETLRLGDDANVTLLTGRIRPLDRDRVLNAILPTLRPSAETESGRPLLVVATQCIEVGADLDFDAVVTDCVSLDALKQRFGRLDRIGRFGESPAVILARQDAVDRKAEPDPIYGEALRAAWQWLEKVASESGGKRGRGKQSHSIVDFGSRWLPPVDPPARSKLLAPQGEAPLLLPSYLDAWAQTAPRPSAEPEVALWLHGQSAASADVQVVWRADLNPENLDHWETIVSLCPPASVEALPLPVYVARDWLNQVTAGEVADLEAATDERLREQEGAPTRPQKRPFLRWSGDESQVSTDPRILQPGDTIVVPFSYGGADRFGWNPDARTSVEDLGDEAQWVQRNRAILRLHAEVVTSWLTPHARDDFNSKQPPLPVASDVQEMEESDHRERIDQFLHWIVHEDTLPDWVRKVANVLLDDPHRRVIAYPDGQGVALRASRRLRQTHTGTLEASEFTSEDDGSSFTTAVALSRHCRGVESFARRFAERCGLPPELTEDVALAAWFHDVGKADPRFQTMLHGGDEVSAAMATEPWAKSGVQGRAERERTRFLAGYPKGERHEILSLAMVQSCVEAAKHARDLDLVLHLVASHHGCCRPLAPPQSEEEVAVALEHGDLRLTGALPAYAGRLDSGVPDRFWRLLRRYGWFGLPYLEAILRLADHRQSEHEENSGADYRGQDGEAR